MSSLLQQPLKFLAASMGTFWAGLLLSHHAVPFDLGIGLTAALTGAVVLWERGQAGAAWGVPGLMALLAAPVVAHGLHLGMAYEVTFQVAPLCGALVGLYVLAGLHSQKVYPALAPVGEGPLGALVVQAQAAHQRLVTQVTQHAAAVPEPHTLLQRSQALVDAVERTAQEGAGWDAAATRPMEAQVREQWAQVQELLRNSADPVTTVEHQRTAAALTSQLEALGRIERNAQRALARVRCQVALLETARLSVMAFASQAGEVRHEDARRLTAMLESATGELDLSAGAMEEAHAGVFHLR